MAKKRTKPPQSSATLAHLRHENEFAQLAASLRDSRFDAIQDRPLVHWTRPSDRRLPLVFMQWPLKKLLKLPFDEVQATPGIGAKKVVGLIELLQRIEKEGDTPAGDASEQLCVAIPAVEPEAKPFDARSVSEAQWQAWCETLRCHELQALPIGRVVPSLCDVPMVIWDTPLGKYDGSTLAEIREMKTHGQKRVRIVLEAYWIVHSTLRDTSPHVHIHLDICPRFVRRLETWIDGQLASEAVPSLSEMRAGLAEPLLNQLQVDVGDRIASLVSGRLGLNGAAVSVRNQAEKVGVTRARVYQWLEECANVMRIRWPAGRWKLRSLRGKLEQHSDASENRELLATIGDIFFPDV